MEKVDQYLDQMRGKKVYFDTNMFIYFFEADETYFERCLPFFQAVENGEIIGITGELTIAELLVKPLQTNDLFSAEKIRTIFTPGGYFKTIQHDRDILEFAAYIRASQNLSMVDTIHVATAIRGDCSFFITNDEKVTQRTKGIQSIWLEGIN